MKSSLAIVLDFDGTIMDTAAAIAAGMAFALRRSRPDLVVDPGRVRSAIGKSIGASFDWISEGRMTEEEKVEATREYRGNHAIFSERHSKPFPGVMETLLALRDREVRLFVVSNKGEKALHFDLDRFGMLDLFEQVLGDESALRKKPESEVFERHVRPVLGSGTDVLVVGDTEIDLEFARRIPAKSVWAAYGYGDPHGCEAMSPDFVISRPDELLRVVGFLPSLPNPT